MTYIVGVILDDYTSDAAITVIHEQGKVQNGGGRGSTVSGKPTYSAGDRDVFPKFGATSLRL